MMGSCVKRRSADREDLNEAAEVDPSEPCVPLKVRGRAGNARASDKVQAPPATDLKIDGRYVKKNIARSVGLVNFLDNQIEGQSLDRFQF